MKYCNDNIRRRDRLLPEQEAIQLLKEGEYGILSLTEPLSEGTGAYGIPLNYVWDENGVIYFHCAPQGHKLACIKSNPNVSFCVVGRTRIVSHKFSTAYESILVRGTASIGLSAEERMQALVLLLDKYSPCDKELGLKYTEKSFPRTEIIRLDIIEISGKTKRIPL